MCDDKISATETDAMSNTPGVLGGVEEDERRNERRGRGRGRGRGRCRCRCRRPHMYGVGERRGKGAFV